MNRPTAPFLLLLFFSTFYAAAQPKISVQHYGMDDGLPQKTVVDMMQDKKGFVWFSTSDGICKFDGVNFHSYRAFEHNDFIINGNRFDHIQPDSAGYIWVRTHGNELYRFDPQREQFANMRGLDDFKTGRFRATGFWVSPSGKVWLTGHNQGAVCFKDTLLAPIAFNTRNRRLLDSRVEKIFEDSAKNTWLLTDNGIYQLSPDLKTQGSFFTNGADFHCAMETKGEIWFGSQGGVIYCYNKQSRKFSTFTINSSSPVVEMKYLNNGQTLIYTSTGEFFIGASPTSGGGKFAIMAPGDTAKAKILSYRIDRQQNIWFQTNSPGVWKFSLATRALKHYQMPTENFADNPFWPKFLMWEDAGNRVWLQQYGGGFGYYDAAKDQLVSVTRLLPANVTGFSAMLYTGMQDRQGNFWLSTRGQGIEKVSFLNPIVRLQPIDSAGNNNVRSIMEDKFHRIWVGTKDDKITVYRSDMTKLGNFTAEGTIGNGKPPGGMAYSMIEDAAGNIWIATKGKGVYKATPDAAGNKYTIKHYQHDKNNPYSLSDNKVYRVYEDHHHRIWIGTYSAGINLVDDKVDGRFYNFRNRFNNYPIQQARLVRSIGEDASGMMYAGTTHGLLVFPSRLAENGPDKFRFYERDPMGKGLSGGDIYDICVTHDDHIYLAISGSGFDLVKEKDAAGYPTRFYNYSAEKGPAPNLTSQIREDNAHYLWIVAESNIMRFAPWNNTFENYPEIINLLKEQNFSEGGDITTKAGDILLGTTGGLIIVNAAKIKPEAFKPYLAFTGFEIANNNVPIGSNSPLAKSIDNLKSVKLNYRQNFITIEFSALDYANTRQLKYGYRLDGVDNDWVTTREQSAKYLNLAPGTYTFHARSTNSKGIWLDNEHMLEIVIVPAIWQTWWAKVLYVLGTFALVFFVSRAFITFYRLKDRLQLEKEQTEMKTNFFTDISHEIRTPLTMIVSPVEQILEEEAVSRPVSTQLELVLKNSRRMLRLVNQILDFRKIQNQLLSIRETVIGAQVAVIAGDFTSTATLQGVVIKVNDTTDGKTVWVDPDSLEKMMFNLLSNAVKHTPAGGIIEVNIFPSGDKIAVQVRDHGHGMSSEILKKLFSRFVSHNPDKTKPSTGIGLSIVKEIVDRHGAEIKVESQENKGSTFTICFLQGAAHFAGLDNILIADSEIKTPETVKLISPVEPAEPQSNTHTETLLLIEDDNDLRQYVAGLLDNEYNVLQAADGETALNIALSKLPDFIVSDIMMPKMDGFQFLSSLRGNPLTSHIPLIFLTAKADPETEIAAYERGADAFMTKPFTAKLLRSRIKTIMEQRRRLYTGTTHQSTAFAQPGLTIASPLKVVDLNEAFLNKIRQEIEKNIGNAEFTVDDLISIMPMSRTVFVKKLKSLTGLSPVEYIRTIKIRHAAQLIETRQYSIKEISHMIGINDTKYFSQRFKEIMGMLPKDYKKQQE